MHRHGLDTVFLAAPTSTERRLEAGGAIFHRLRLPGLAHRRHRRARFASRRRGAAGRRGARGHRSAAGGGLRHLQARSTWRNWAGRWKPWWWAAPSCNLIERNPTNASLEIQLESFVRELKHGFGFGAAGMTRDEARASAGGIPRAHRRCGPAHRGAAERTHARGGGDRPREARSELPIYEPKREEQVFANVTGSNGGPLTPDALRASSSASSTKCARFSECAWKPRGRNKC
jgi:hypothetical protein